MIIDHPDLRISRIRKDERDVKLLLEMLENHYRYLFGFDAGDLRSLSTAAVPTLSAALDMLYAQSEGEKVYEQFMEADYLRMRQRISLIDFQD